MAEAYGKLTGRPGVCIVTRGPGATHASVGVHTAFQDSTPLILLVGQVASDQEEREAFQEIDYRRMFGPMAKWVAQIDRTDRIPEFIARAYTTACAGRPGRSCSPCPRTCSRARATRPTRLPFQVASRSPAAADIDALREPARGGRAAARDHRRRRLDAAAAADTARRSSRRTRCRPARRSAARTRSTTTRPATSATSASASTRRSPTRVKEADVLLVVGPRLGEMTTSGYTLLDAADAEADARARASRCRGARPRLPARAADPLRHGAVRGSRARPARRAALARVDARGARGLRGLAAARPDARRARPRRLRRAPARARARRDRHERRRQLHRLGASLLALARLPEPARADERRDGLRRAGGGRREGARARARP